MGSLLCEYEAVCAQSEQLCLLCTLTGEKSNERFSWCVWCCRERWALCLQLVGFVVPTEGESTDCTRCRALSSALLFSAIDEVFFHSFVTASDWKLLQRPRGSPLQSWGAGKPRGFLWFLSTLTRHFPALAGSGSCPEVIRSSDRS